MDVKSEESFEKVDMSPSLDLSQIDAVCNHFALAAVQRFFYVQALDMSYNLWKGCLETDFYEAMMNVCAVRFWRSRYTQKCQYELCISQPRYDPEYEKGKQKKNDDYLSHTCGLGHFCALVSGLIPSEETETGYVAVSVPHSEK